MTCVVAISEGGIVYMGADAAGVAGYSIRTRKDPKIYKVGPFLFGFTMSFRMGQLLGHAFTAPDRDPRIATDKWMSTVFIDAVRTCLKAGGWAKKENETEEGGTFLVGYEGRIFRIDSDYQVGESQLQYEAVGCGDDIAMGSLYTTHAMGGIGPSARITTALCAAESFSAGVRGPIYQLQSDPVAAAS